MNTTIIHKEHNGIKLKITEQQDEYNYVRSVNRDLKIKSKEEYMEKQRSHSHYIENPEEYFSEKGVWVDWCDFIGDTVKTK